MAKKIEKEDIVPEDLIQELIQDIRNFNISEETKAKMEAEMTPMLELSKTLLDTISEFMVKEGPYRHWVADIMMALARVTCITMSAMDATKASTVPAMDLYTKVMLPMCNDLIVKETNSIDTNAN